MKDWYFLLAAVFVLAAVFLLAAPWFMGARLNRREPAAFVPIAGQRVTVRRLFQGRYITPRQDILVATAIGSASAPSTCQTNLRGPVEGLNLRPESF